MSILKCTVALIGVVVTLALGLVAVTAAVQEPPSIPHGSVNELMEKLASPSAGERKEAREGLLALGAAAVPLSLFDRQEAVPLLHQELEASDWQQWEAVNALGRVWNDETAAKLIIVLQEAPEDIRKEAALSAWANRG